MGLELIGAWGYLRALVLLLPLNHLLFHLEETFVIWSQLVW